MSAAACHVPSKSTLATRRTLRALPIGLALVLLLATLPPASAHTDLAASTPRSGASLTRVPREVTLTFNEQISSALSAVSLQVAGGRATPLTVTPGRDRNTIVTTDIEAASLPESTRWLVRYRVTSADGHPIAGELTFDVRRPPPPAPAGAGPTPTAEQSSTASSNTADAPEEPSTRTSIGVVAVLAAALLALLGIAARRVGRSRA